MAASTKYIYVIYHLTGKDTFLYQDATCLVASRNDPNLDRIVDPCPRLNAYYDFAPEVFRLGVLSHSHPQPPDFPKHQPRCCELELSDQNLKPRS